LYLCTATNIWTAVEGDGQPGTGSTGGVLITNSDGGSGYTIDVDPAVVATQSGPNTYTGMNDFSRATSLRVVVSAAIPAAADCNSSDKIGRLVLRAADESKQGSLYLCQATGTGAFGWKRASYGYGSGRPQSCEAGEMFFDMAGAAGQQWFGCTSSNAWTNLWGRRGFSALSDQQWRDQRNRSRLESAPGIYR
jgi:hypothetical protein